MIEWSQIFSQERKFVYVHEKIVDTFLASRDINGNNSSRSDLLLQSVVVYIIAFLKSQQKHCGYLFEES